MAQTPALTGYQDIPCCPNLDTGPVCDFIDMRRRLLFPTAARTESGQAVSIEVIIHTRFERCSGPLALGGGAPSHQAGASIVLDVGLPILHLMVVPNMTVRYTYSKSAAKFPLKVASRDPHHINHPRRPRVDDAPSAS